MLAPFARRPYALALIVVLSVGILLLLHRQSDEIRLRFGTPLASETSRLSPAALRLEAICELQDPFDLEYGRTNIRLTRAYEGQ